MLSPSFYIYINTAIKKKVVGFLCEMQETTLTCMEVNQEALFSSMHCFCAMWHVDYTAMFINWTDLERCGQRSRDRSITWSGLVLFLRISGLK